MRMISWEKLPPQMQTEAVKPYYEILQKKQISLIFKRLFDIVVSLIMLLILSPVFFVLAIAIKLDSKGPVFYRQVRVTQYGKEFRIFKFRTMVNNADKIGSQVTVGGDSRITRVGKVIRECRLDEIGQLLNILGGSMTFVGTRPEVPKYVEKYTSEMWATLLLPAGVTSDEAALLDAAEDVDATYIQDVLPGKMKYNLLELKKFRLSHDFYIMWDTIVIVLCR